uniref:Uncharacterized protein n=1 Tax=Solanum tuberosum TaxID=4113 RepID=M1DVH8_SOLTU
MQAYEKLKALVEFPYEKQFVLLWSVFTPYAGGGQRQNKLYAFQARQDHEDSPDMVTDNSIFIRGRMFPRGRYCNTPDLRKEKIPDIQKLQVPPMEATTDRWTVSRLTARQSPLSMDQSTFSFQTSDFIPLTAKR